MDPNDKPFSFSKFSMFNYLPPDPRAFLGIVVSIQSSNWLGKNTKSSTMCLLDFNLFYSKTSKGLNRNQLDGLSAFCV